ncbi:MAG: polyphenol oxidase family protein [Candidatus Pacebacteria bacterium]|nr:polyphenol oxidase family protein [Candidatus Paceibacterota bacterium]
MLTFSLKNLNIFISQRADGDFRQTQTVEQFLASRQLVAAEDQFVHLQLDNKDQVLVLDAKQVKSKQTSLLLTGDAILSHWQRGDRQANKTLISMVLGDCFPLIFFDQKSKNMAMIHAGWEPLYLNILDQVWQQMLGLWQTKAEHLLVFLGPGIRAKSYLVEKEPRQSQDPSWKKYIKKQPDTGLWQIDLPAFIKNQLFETYKLPKQQLIDCQLDTYALPKEFFSYRRSQELLAVGNKKAAQSANGRFFVSCRLL